MDEQDYNFNIEDDELDLLSDESFPSASTPAAAKYSPGDDDDADFDILADEPQEEDENAPGPEIVEEDTPPLTEEEAEAAAIDAETFQKLAEDLTEIGILIREEGEEEIKVNNAEAFATKFRKSYQTGAINYIDSVVGKYGPQYADAWNVIFEQGLDPFEYFTQQQTIANYANLDIEDEEVQKHIYRDFHRRQGLTEDRIEAKLQRLLDTDDEGLKEESKDYHQLLVQHEQQILQAKAAEAQAMHQEEEQRRAQYIQTVQQVLGEKLQGQEFDGIPMSEQDAYKVLDFIATPKWQLPNGQVVADMDRWWMEMKANPVLAAKFALMATNNFSTARIEKKVVSKQNAKLFNNLTQSSKVAKRQQSNKTSNGFFD